VEARSADTHRQEMMGIARAQPILHPSESQRSELRGVEPTPAIGDTKVRLSFRGLSEKSFLDPSFSLGTTTLRARFSINEILERIDDRTASD